MEITQRLSGGAVGRNRSRSASRLLFWRSQASILTIAGILVALAMIALVLGHLTDFYSVDGDIKYLAAFNLAHHLTDPSINYPSLKFDPAGRYSLPLTAWYGGHDYAGYSLPFLYISAIALRLFGTAGIIVPAIIATGILLFAQLRLADLIGLRGNRVLLLLATVAATPVLFYSVSFWEHTWGVALLLAGFALLLLAVRDSNYWLALAGGGLFAGAVLMRRDTLIPAVIFLALMPLALRRRQTVIVCAIAAAALVLPIATIVLLHPEPLGLGLTHASPGRAGIGVTRGLSKLQKLEFLLFGGGATGLVAAVCAGVVLARRFFPRLVIPMAVCGSLVSGLALVAGMLTQYTFSDENVLAFCPLAIWGLLLPALGESQPKSTGESVRNERMTSTLLWAVAVIGCVGIVVMAFDSGGAQWGPRYLLFAFPVLILSAIKARECLLMRAVGGLDRRMVNYGFAFVLALSFLVQGLGLFALHVKQDLAQRAGAAILATHANVIVSAFPVIDLLAPSYESHTYLYAPTESDLRTLMSKLARQGDRRVVMLCDPVAPCTWNGYSGWTHGHITNVKHSVRFAVYRLGRADLPAAAG